MLDKNFIERLKSNKLKANEEYLKVKMPPRNDVVATLTNLEPADRMQDDGEMSYRLRATFELQPDETTSYKAVTQVWGFSDSTYTDPTFGTGKSFIELLFQTIASNNWDHEPSVGDLVDATYLVDLKRVNGYDTVYPKVIIAFPENGEVTNEA